MPDVRKYTNMAYDLVQEDALGWKDIGQMALSYMSEDDVEDMLRSNCILEDLGLEEEDE